MKDGNGRNINYLRISLTDRCNLRCRYCMPEQGVPLLAQNEILTFSEIQRLVCILAKLGVNRLRLTGGEPLVRKGMPQLAADLKTLPGIDFLGITTNGVLLEENAQALHAAGVDSVNISLDTLDAERFARHTRRATLPQVLRGLHKTLALGFPSVKLNCVLSPDSTQQDWMGVAALAQTLPVDVRFIEWMPIREGGEGGNGGGVCADEVLAALATVYGPLEKPEPAEIGGPALYTRPKGFKGRVGVIPAMSHSFCASCNRVRLTATGELRLCLFYDEGVPLKPLLRGGASDEEIAHKIQSAVRRKPTGHGALPRRSEKQNESPENLLASVQGMSQIGG